jgi:hypothetical protein
MGKKNIVKANKLPRKVHAVFYHSFMSGLANRMRAWVANSAFAEYLDVPFIMKWRADDACGKKMFDELFEIPENMQYEVGRRYQPDANTLWVKKNYPNNKFHEFFIDGNFELTQKEFQKYVDNQKQYVKPLPHIQKDIDEYADKLDIENTIGLHIRRTDLKEQDKSPDTWFDQNIKMELEKNSDAKFLLATDNKWTEEKFMMKYDEKMVKIDRDFDEIEGGEIYPGGHRHRHSPTEQGLVDMMLLGKTKRVYGCHGSSFGRFGAWYGGKKFILPDLD